MIIKLKRTNTTVSWIKHKNSLIGINREVMFSYLLKTEVSEMFLNKRKKNVIIQKICENISLFSNAEKIYSTISFDD